MQELIDCLRLCKKAAATRNPDHILAASTCRVIVQAHFGLSQDAQIRLALALCRDFLEMAQK